jgi:hypothetical protein
MTAETKATRRTAFIAATYFPSRTLLRSSLVPVTAYNPYGYPQVGATPAAYPFTGAASVNSIEKIPIARRGA